MWPTLKPARATRGREPCAPGRHVTGMSLEQNDIASKRLGLLRDVVPNLRRLAIMFNADYPSSVRETGEVQAAARTLGLEVAPHEIRRAQDIAPVFGDFLSPKRMTLLVRQRQSFEDVRDAKMITDTPLLADEVIE